MQRAQDEVDGAEYTSVLVTTGQTYIFNNSKPPFDDIRMRQAFAMGVDWQAMADTVFGEGAVAPYNFTLEGTEFYTEDAALPAYDPDAAQALIDEYAAENGGGPVVLDMLAFQQSLDQARGEYIQTALSQLENIEVNMTVNDSPTNIGLVLAGDYMLSSWGFPVVAGDPGHLQRQLQPGVDQLLEVLQPRGRRTAARGPGDRRRCCPGGGVPADLHASWPRTSRTSRTSAR